LELEALIHRRIVRTLAATSFASARAWRGELADDLASDVVDVIEFETNLLVEGP